MIYIALILWLLYLAIEGVYDSYLYRFLPIEYRFNSHGDHIPHTFALTQRLLVLLAIILQFSALSVLVNGVALLLMLPFVQTGFYFEGHHWLVKWYGLKPITDARGKPYRFFSYAHSNSSRFPDKNPWLRLAYFIVGLCIFFIFNIAIL